LIQDRNETLSVTSTIEGDKVAMSIDQNAMAHIMSILTDLYSDPELAVIREYSTNAWDAHVEAGVQRPIEVTLPSEMSPLLRIRDFGVGLTVDDIHSIYSKYGASTKRATNDQVGMLGLGCKSALTYAQQFTLTSCKDGTKVAVSISRDDDGGGSMTVVDTTSCDQGNGTEIIIPARQHNDLARKAEQFFSVWPQDAVLVNGQPPRDFRAEAMRVTDDVYLSIDQRSYVVMGNVPYPVPTWPGLHLERGIVAFVPIGSVNFPPSRESLMDTTKTQATLAAVVAEYREGIKNAVQEKVDAADSHVAALAAVTEWSKFGDGKHVYTYRGQDVPTRYETVEGDPSILVSDAWARYRQGYASTERGLTAGSWGTTVWVHDYAPGNHNINHKRKMQKWCEDRGLTSQEVKRFVMLRGDAPESDFIDAGRIVSWDTIKAIKLPRAVTQGTRYRPARIAGSYDVFTDDGFTAGMAAEEFKGKRHVLYCRGNRYLGEGFEAKLSDHLTDYVIVCLPENRIGKFVRDFPKAKPAREAVDAAYLRWEKRITPAQRETLKIVDENTSYYSRDDARSVLRKLDETKLHDPDLRVAIVSSRVDVTTLLKQRAAFGKHVERSGWDNPLNNYPLFNEHHTDHEHTYLYLNAAYAAREEG
jgi:hypothetical protein